MLRARRTSEYAIFLESETSEGQCLPTSDNANSSALYKLVMSIVTYITISIFITGLRGESQFKLLGFQVAMGLSGVSLEILG